MKVSYSKPLLPLRDIVIFPSLVVPLFVGRDKSIKALQEVMKSDKSIVLVTQKILKLTILKEVTYFNTVVLASFTIIKITRWDC